MVVDTSALIAILWNEVDAHGYAGAIDSAQSAKLSSVTYLEASIVLAYRGGTPALAEFDLLLRDAGINIVPFTEEHARLARQAYVRFGRGTGHGARLNFGDCASYALAHALGEPLLFKGDDFTKTDVNRASTS